jgi:hypothetical protein
MLLLHAGIIIAIILCTTIIITDIADKVIFNDLKLLIRKKGAEVILCSFLR